MKWRFAMKFLLSFAALLVIWWAVEFSTWYRAIVLWAVQLLSPLVTGWWLDYDRPGLASEITFRSADRQLPMVLQLPALSMGIVPLLSLLFATPGLGPRAAVVRGALAVALYCAIDTAVVLAYPFIMDRPNVFKDTLGVFAGLIAFVVAPLGLWFVLTYPFLRPLWQIGTGKR